MISYIIWNADPTAINIAGHPIRWYGLLMAIGFYLGYFLLMKILKREKMPENQIHALAIFVFFGTILGLRLGHCFFYEPGFYLKNPMEIFKVWEGGLASHGGAVGILLAVFIYCKKYKLSYVSILDKLIIIIPLVGAMVRIGNLINSEIIGSVTSVPWAFVFKKVDAFPRHPSQIYESISCLIIFGVLMFLYFKKNAAQKTGYLFGAFLIMLFSVRFLVEFVKDVQVDFEKQMPINMGQILSIPFIIAGIYLLYRANKHYKLKTQ